MALSSARDEFTRSGQPLETAHVAVDLAELYEWLGDFQRAREEASRTRAVIEPLLTGGTPSFADAFAAMAGGQLEKAKDTAKLTAIWFGLTQLEARVARTMGEFDTAMTLFLDVREKTEQWVVPAVDFQLARTEIERGRVVEGLASLQPLKPKMTGLLRPRLGALLSWEAEALLRLSRPQEAVPIATEAAADLARYSDLDSLWKTQSRVAQGLDRSGDRRAALTAYRDAVVTLTDLRRFPMGYRLESTFFADKLPLFDAAIFLAAELGDTAACFQLMEQVKSRALTSMLTAPPVANGASNERELAVDELSRQVDALEYQAYRQGWNDETTALRDRLLNERTRLLERILLEDPRWRTLTRPAEADLSAVTQSLAGSTQAALSLYYRSGRVVALLIHRGRAQVAVQSLSAESVAAVEAYHRNLESPTPDHRAFDPAGFPELAADRLVPRDLLDQALGADGLVVVPHGPLHLLPWPALACDGRRLFERCPVGVLPNLNCLVILGAIPARTPAIALLGAPSYQGLAGLAELPLAAEELFTAAQIFGDRVIGTWVGGDATQEAYRNVLANPAGAHGILHLACHGDMVAGDPENSGLLLSDARLDASDIARRKIQFDEVVLSSCASGYRPTRVGGIELTADDMVGVPGAFLEAGARSVLVSIPPARDDAALAFMTLYYEHRAEDQPPMQALREAQLAMLSAGDYPAHLWAGFVLYGR
jgi:CHAT domain-containing protein